MKVLFDTNVILDAMLVRYPFVKSAAQLLDHVESGVLTGYLCATTLTTIYYVANKDFGRVKAVNEIKKLLSLFEIADVNWSILDKATEINFSDYEDGVLHAAAEQCGVESIVTRNKKDFTNATLQIYTPDELLHLIHSA